MFLPRNTSSDPLAIEQFHAMLRPWCEKETDPKATIGDVSKRKQTPWLFVTDGTITYCINADTNQQGVAGYLAMVDQANGNLQWSLRDGNKVVFGKYALHQPGFFMYRY